MIEGLWRVRRRDPGGTRCVAAAACWSVGCTAEDLFSAKGFTNPLVADCPWTVFRTRFEVPIVSPGPSSRRLFDASFCIPTTTAWFATPCNAFWPAGAFRGAMYVDLIHNWWLQNVSKWLGTLLDRSRRSGTHVQACRMAVIVAVRSRRCIRRIHCI